MVQQHARAALRHCVETTAARGPMGALLWPLFAAACEAVHAEDRALAKKAFRAIEQRQGMTNIQEAWAIIQEVWRRLDALEEEEGGETEAEITVHHRGRGSTLLRTETGKQTPSTRPNCNCYWLLAAGC